MRIDSASAQTPRVNELLSQKQQLARELVGGDGELALTELKDSELLKLVALDVSTALAD